MEGEFADINIKDFRAIFIETEIGEIKIEERQDGVHITLDNMVIIPNNNKILLSNILSKNTKK